MTLVAAFDMGTRNFAFCVERINPLDLAKIPKIQSAFDIEGCPLPLYGTHLEQIYLHGHLVECQRIDIIEYGKSRKITNIYLALTLILDSFTPLWDAVDIVLIEQQMAYGRNKANIQALRLSQHCLSYFYTLYGSFKTIHEWPSTQKTRLLGCPTANRKTHKGRKHFAIQLATQILEKRKDTLDAHFQKMGKLDDVSDCILMIQTYKHKFIHDTS